MPLTPETNLNPQNYTQLLVAKYASPAFSAPPYSTNGTNGKFLIATASFTPTNQFQPTGNGAITFFRAYDRNNVSLGDFTVGSTWLPSTLATQWQYCINKGNIYLCVGTGMTDVSGGPSGIGLGIPDGAATWDYVGPADTTWTINKLYSTGNIVTNGGNRYVCTVAGTSAAAGTGPAGTGQAIQDNTVRWNYLAQAAYFDVTMGNCNVTQNIMNSQTGGTTPTLITLTQTLVIPFA